MFKTRPYRDEAGSESFIRVWSLAFMLISIVIALATWHAYRDAIDVSQWPENN